MKFDPELEEILETFGKKQPPREMEEILPPKPPVEEKKEELPPPKPSVEEKEEELPPPKPSAEKPSEKPAADTENEPDPDELEWSEPKKPSLLKAKLLPALRSFFEKMTLKKAGITVGALVLAVVLLFGGVKVVQYAKTAYLRSYEKQYGVTFPIGIKKKYCDAYGVNQTLAGTITIPDCDYEATVYGAPDGSGPRLEKGSAVGQDMHFLSIALNRSECDIEKVFCTKDAFIASSQEIDFEDYYGEKGRYRVIAVFYTNTKPEDDNGYVYPYNCFGTMTADSFDRYKEKTMLKSNFSTGYEMQYEDYYLTVSADSTVLDGYRFVAVAVKEKRIHKVSSVTETKRQCMTQAYCDKLGVRNNYFLVKPWYPEIILNAESGQTRQTYIYDYQQ